MRRVTARAIESKLRQVAGILQKSSQRPRPYASRGLVLERAETGVRKSMYEYEKIAWNVQKRVACINIEIYTRQKYTETLILSFMRNQHLVTAMAQHVCPSRYVNYSEYPGLLFINIVWIFSTECLVGLYWLDE